MKIYNHKNYNEYVNVQKAHNKNHVKNMGIQDITIQDGDNVSWAKDDHLNEMYGIIKKYQDLNNIEYILCHGVRCGYESKYFMDKFSAEKVYSTDIAKNAFLFNKENFYEMDFDCLKEEWIDKFDVLYSNSLDHSRNPKITLNIWKKELKRGGLMLVVFSCGDRITDCDCFALDLNNYLKELSMLSKDVGLDLLEYSKLNLTGGGGTINVIFKKGE